MIHFDYGTQLSPYPIKLSIGHLKKPLLSEIANPEKGMSFELFNYYEVMLQLTPELFFTKFCGENGKALWNNLSDEEKEKLTLYELIINDKTLIETFTEIFNFFFIEEVVFYEGFFILLHKDITFNPETLEKDDFDLVSENIFKDVLNAIQQVCCLNVKEEEEIQDKYKNKLAQKLHEKILKAEKEKKQKAAENSDLSIPNIISAVSNKHPTLSPISIWDLTIFQLLDSFNRLKINNYFDLNTTRVSVWGDEKSTYNAALWYKNIYDKNENNKEE